MSANQYLSRALGQPASGNNFLEQLCNNVAQELEHWIYNTTELMNPNWLNLDELAKGAGGYTSRFRFRKPRIDVAVTMTSKGNLAVEWEPTGWHSNEPTDFKHFTRFGRDAPANRLVFIRDLEALKLIHKRPSGQVEACIFMLKAVSDLLDTVKTFLHRNFEVTIRTDYYLLRNLDDRVVGFEICRVNDWKAHRENRRKQQQSEAEYANLGITTFELLDFLASKAGATRAHLVRSLQRRGLQITDAKLMRLQKCLEPVRSFWANNTSTKISEAEGLELKQREQDLSRILAAGGTATSRDLWAWRLGEDWWEDRDLMDRINALFEAGLVVCGPPNARGEAVYSIPAEVRRKFRERGAR